VSATASPRDDAAWYTPTGLAEDLDDVGDPVRGGLPVGAPGKVGLLELTLCLAGGITRIRHQYQRSPLHVFRPICLDPGRPDMAFVFVQQSGDGLVQGDRYRIDIHCESGAAAHITTQAATNVFRAQENVATQMVNLSADAGVLLEYLPDPLIPFRGARLFQRTRVIAEQSSTVIFGDIVLPGRVARGEAHAYDVIRAETEVRRPDGALLLADLLRLSPRGGEDPHSFGVLGRHDVVATLYVISNRREPGALVSRLRECLDSQADIAAGATELPNDCGAIARILGPSSKVVKQAMRAAWNSVRLAVVGVPAPDLRKG
jgi:urease accessory protein